MLLQILLVTGSKDHGRWVVPGGGVEPKEDIQQAALREAYEEAGVKGSLGRCLGEFEVSLKEHGILGEGSRKGIVI